MTLLTDRDIALRLLREMEADNGCKFSNTQAQLTDLATSVGRMRAAGVEFDDETIELIAAGDQDEAEERFGKLAGYSTVSALLAKIGGF